MRATATITSCAGARLRFDGGDPLACVYAVVEAAPGSSAARFLAGWAGCCDEVSLDWRAGRSPAGASVGIEVARCCGPRDALRLAFDLHRHRDALDALAATEVLVIADGPFGEPRAGLAAYGIDGAALRHATRAADAGLRRLAAALN